ncbi:hypothetical protein Q5Y75_16575 [Ruegeria sp. 2205SS24-7]|uniref:hypothetical protein n=1 Tax=Ruegeria discodermiae TaxID=3064389 RepID=UPI002740C95B|nr:hypothetical protein [Ruegeria sp. 2205SS24-7]MDP5218843.1 hypothetical protein [Ruegeria sp. 2205SS24-7]
MEALDSWFRSEAKKQSRLVSLYSCLLTSRLAPYFVFRLRYLLVLEVLVLCVHVAEFIILSAHLPPSSVILIFLFRAGALTIRGAWWGALEVMRERIRSFRGQEATDRTGTEISVWLVFSMLIGSVLAIGMLGLTGWRYGLSGSTETALLISIYIAVITIELALQFPMQVLHSGIYARRRIYRSFWSVVIPTILQIAVLVALTPIAPVSALIVSILASSACALVVSLVYVLRMYQITGIRAKLSLGWSELRAFLSGLPHWSFATSAISGLSLRVDGVLVLVILGLSSFAGQSVSLTSGHPDWNSPHLGVYLYLILPAVRAAYSWTTLFYFDLVRLRLSPLYTQMRALLFRRLTRAAVILAAIFWGLSFAVSRIVYPDISATFIIALLPVFVVRAWLGLLQMRAFTMGYHARVILSVVTLATAVFLIAVGESADPYELLEVLAGFCLACAILLCADWWFGIGKPPPVQQSLHDLGTLFFELEDETPIYRARLVNGLRNSARASIGEMFNERLNGSGHWAWLQHNAILYFATDAKNTDPVLPSSLVTNTGGALYSVEQLHPKHGKPTKPTARHARDKADTDALVSEFKTYWPNGTVIDLDSHGYRKELSQFSPDLLRSILPIALRAFKAGDAFVTHGGMNIYPLVIGGRIRMIFLVSASDGSPLGSPWPAVLRNWQAGALAAKDGG